ncbi:MAG: hypothetical protein ACLFNZ_08825 [Spirochaetaceae bacterium]
MRGVYTSICILLCAVLLLPAAYGDNAGPEAEGLSTEYILNFLLSEEDEDIDAEIRRLSEELEKSPSGSSEEAHVRYSLGVLHIYRCIRSKEQKKADAYRALELLEEIEKEFGHSKLFKVHLGMAYSFIAEIRRTFGLSQLKKMHSIMTSIPEDHPDWLTRFLRGTTLFEVGTELPGIFLVRKIKKDSLNLGRADLEYIEQRYRASPGGGYNPEAYNFEEKPVPTEIAEQARTMLQKTDE